MTHHKDTKDTKKGSFFFNKPISFPFALCALRAFVVNKSFGLHDD